MRKVRLGRTGVSVSAVGLGSWAYSGAHRAGRVDVGWSGHDDGDALAALARAAELGIDHWDTADVYGDGRAEQLVGRALRLLDRERIFLATKVGWDMDGFPHYYHPELIRRRLERSLANLGTDHVDLYYLHHCDFGRDDEHLEAAVEVLRELRAAGKVRFLGLSDWDAAKLRRVAEKMDPDVIQVYRNVVDDDYRESGLAGWVRDHDAGAVFFSPLKHGLLLGKYTQPASFPRGDVRNRISDFGDAETLERYRDASRELAERYAGHPQPRLHALLGALLADTPTGTVLVGQRDPAQAEAAATAGEALSEDERDWVVALYRGRGR